MAGSSRRRRLARALRRLRLRLRRLPGRRRRPTLLTLRLHPWARRSSSNRSPSGLPGPLAVFSAAYYLLPGPYEWEEGSRRELITVGLLPVAGVASFAVVTGRLTPWIGHSLNATLLAWGLIVLLFLPMLGSLPRVAMAGASEPSAAERHGVALAAAGARADLVRLGHGQLVERDTRRPPVCLRRPADGRRLLAHQPDHLTPASAPQHALVQRHRRWARRNAQFAL